MYRLNTTQDSGLMGTVDLTNQVAVCLARMYQRGFKVDMSALQTVQAEFEQERSDLINSLQSHVKKLMGDTPINLNSPEQLGWVVYGRKVIDKAEWGQKIDPYMDGPDFNNMVQYGT